MSQPRKFARWLSAESGLLGRLMSECRQHDDLDRELADSLDAIDPDLVNQCSVARLRGDEIIVVCANGSWATRLRFHSANLLNALKRRHGLASLKRIVVRTAPPIPDNKPKSRRVKAAPISGANRAIIRDTAAGINDPELRSALERLAKSGR